MKAGRYDHISDAQLLQYYYTDHNQQWIGILLERYTLLLFGVCMKYLKDEDAAKDAVQAVFLKVLTEVNKYRIEYFKSWLYMVAKNHCLMNLRGNGGKKIKELKEEHVKKPEEEMADVREKEQQYEKLEEAINELNEEQRQCVTLFYLQKNSYQQISDITGYSTMQVKSYIQNGKRNLKIILDKKLKEADRGKNG